MSFISQANGPANFRPRLKLAASALVLVALSGVARFLGNQP